VAVALGAGVVPGLAVGLAAAGCRRLPVLVGVGVGDGAGENVA
jgi:hypothetical protein